MEGCRYLLPLLLSLGSASHAAPPESADLTDRLAACTACHGAQGEGMSGSIYYPHLAGKPAQYLFRQLRAFRDGGRNYPQMGWLMRNMDDAYLQAIAQHFAAMPPRTRAPGEAARTEHAAIAQRARQLIEHGDPARGIPACASCHGTDLAGLEPAVPGLIGLPEEYVVAQFGGWRTGVRTAQAPDCMAVIARALDPGEIRAIAAWLSVQAQEEPQRPAAAGSFMPPLACADLPHAVVQP